MLPVRTIFAPVLVPERGSRFHHLFRGEHCSVPPLVVRALRDETTAEPVAGASAERQIRVVHRGSFTACCGGREPSPMTKRKVRLFGGERTYNREFLTKKLELARPGEGLGAVARAELAVDVARVALDGAHGDEEVPGHLRVCPSRGQKVQHLELAFAQGIFVPACAVRRQRDVGSSLGNRSPVAFT